MSHMSSQIIHPCPFSTMEGRVFNFTDKRSRKWYLFCKFACAEGTPHNILSRQLRISSSWLITGCKTKKNNSSNPTSSHFSYNTYVWIISLHKDLSWMKSLKICKYFKDAYYYINGIITLLISCCDTIITCYITTIT